MEHTQGKIHGFLTAAGATILLIALILRSQDLVSRIRGGTDGRGGQTESNTLIAAPKELETHIVRIRSTDEYHESPKYEALTPSELGDTMILSFCQVPKSVS